MSDEAGFWDTLRMLVPLGLVGAFSWMPVTGVVVLLLSPGGRAKVPAFVVGRVFGLAVVTVAFVAGARALPSVPHLDGRIVGSIEVLVGVALVVLGILGWHRRHREHHRATPAWSTRLGDASALAVFTTSVLVDLQPKGLLLGLSAGAVVRGGSMPLPESVLAVALYLAISASSVVLPVVAVAVAPSRTRRWLRGAEGWLARHGSLTAAVVAALVGLVLVVDAYGRF